MIITRSIVLSPESDDALFYPRIGYRNLFREGTVTVSGETAAGPKENAYDGFTYDFWRSAAGGDQWIAVEVSPSEEVDYLAVAAHTLAGCDLTPQYSADGISWIDLATQFQPSNNNPIVWEFDAVIGTHFRLLIENAPDVVAIGAIHCGAKLTMQRGLPVGWQPPSLNEDIKFTNTMSEGGQILGRNIVSRGASVTLDINPITWGFARADWDDFIQVANTIACFFWWQYEGYAEVLYGGMTENSGQFSEVNFLNVSAKFQGIIR